jgi:hypothetical protein
MGTKRSASNQILKFSLATTDVVQLTLPEGAEILRVDDDVFLPRAICLSIRLDLAPGKAVQVRTFAVYENGRPTWDCNQKYIGSVPSEEVGVEPKHVFELFDFTYAPGTLSVK